MTPPPDLPYFWDDRQVDPVDDYLAGRLLTLADLIRARTAIPSAGICGGT